MIHVVQLEHEKGQRHRVEEGGEVYIITNVSFAVQHEPHLSSRRNVASK